MLTEQNKKLQAADPAEGTLGERMQSGGTGEAVDNELEPPVVEEEEVSVPGVVLPGEGLRLSNTPDAMPALIAALRKWRGMTQAELGQAIGYPAPVIGNIEQGSRKLGLKTLGDLFAALGGELYIEYRQK
ncbi:XRE family transcriptional regulator [Fibrisoma montanum]|uniref:XRE family transcriptional regulator n=1 Tax=Fibrisoma montanum TaxID=2305895 RepID=A0A418M134_9BACT|nr:helix-turn-helix transcriptional regulator [Fibrisoma montanum]RIV19408.1 XRE family transcriptional regulator [Fibrisoma montanum]